MLMLLLLALDAYRHCQLRWVSPTEMGSLRGDSRGGKCARKLLQTFPGSLG
jgi:hypothetical protein